MSALAAIRRGFEIALDEGYETTTELQSRTGIVDPAGNVEPESIQRIAVNGDARAILRWSMLGSVIIEFSNEAGAGGITLTDLMPAVKTRMTGLAGPDFARHAAASFRELCPNGLPDHEADRDEIALGGPNARSDLTRALAAMAACSVVSSGLDVIEATQTLTWEAGAPIFTSMGTTRDGETIEAVPRGSLARIIGGLAPILVAKVRPPIANIDRQGCPNYMIRDDLETHPSLKTPEDVIRAIRNSAKASDMLGIPRGRACFEIREIQTEQ